MQAFSFEPPTLGPDDIAMRGAIRSFLAGRTWSAARRVNNWAQADPDFSRELGAAGFIGMTWPRTYGGQGRSAMARLIVLEELLAAGAPVGAHWITDRQTGPLLLRYGTPAQRERWLPGMVRGEVFACIGLSEPGAGSDLAAVRSRATKVDGGWLLSGQKLWTSNAGIAHVMVGLFRTGGGSERQAGLSQFLVPMDTPGIRVVPIRDMTGASDFNEVFFDEVRLGDDALLGVEGEGWGQVTAELALERSGPERYLSAHALLVALARVAQGVPALQPLLGSLAAALWTLRQLSWGCAAKLAAGQDPAVEAAVVKVLGNAFEQALPQIVAGLPDAVLDRDAELRPLLDALLLASPSFSLRGGTTEIMRGMIARGLGLR
ncbi:acyl-CoA dehydrogenase family protein [Sandaracinobacteroides saxicola]|uniref:acyl-CoA dehydrogenase family protein n=1 Tax=Sandaracinobacteroides saxicola TaxID=2759707 RepID=UPI001FB0B7C5|nr:acyl-CoA dehydrogenase family protein [Sandaracinobacteroides saxicola]